MTINRASSTNDAGVLAAAAAALEFVLDGTCVGLGSGRASSAFIRALGERCRNGLHVRGVATSAASATLATRVGIPLTGLEDGMLLELTVDGADEVTPNLDMVKGWGGALVRERIVAVAAKRQVILVGTDKLVTTIGERGRIPVEVIPMAQWPVTHELKALSLAPTLRMDSTGANPYVTDNGNVIIDFASPQLLVDGNAARALERIVLDIVGVVDTGLFLGTAERVLVGHADGRVETLLRNVG